MISVELARRFIERVTKYTEYNINIMDENGRKKRYRKKTDPKTFRENLKMIMEALFIPPGCFGIWALIGVFLLICWLTAFGF